MLSFTQLQTIGGDLSGNTSATNLSRLAYLANIEQRYLLEKFFSNEATFTITTVGGTNQTVTAAPIVGAVSATLSSAWTFPSCMTSVTFSDGEVRPVTFTNGSTAITWQNGLIGTSFTLTAAPAAGATSATLSTAWTHNTGASVTNFADGEQKTVTYTSGSTVITWSGGLSGTSNAVVYTSINTTAIGIGGVQSYRLPSDYSKLKSGTLTIGNLKWTPNEILTRQEWNELNVFPYYADIPSKFFIWNNKFELWPIPSTTGNLIAFNYKRRIPDLSIADYITGTVSVSNGGTTVTGSGTTWTPTTNSVSESRWVQISQTAGDNLWYQVSSVDSTTSLTLYAPYQGITVTGGSYTLGQMPILMEDFHDMLFLSPLVTYYTSIVDNRGKREYYQRLYDQKLELLKEYAGSKTVNVNLSRAGISRNPNLYSQNFG